MKYIIVYHGCSSKDKAKRLPSCTPTLNQVREYVDSDRWQLCNHPGSCDSDGVSFDRTYTFVEPYCSEACETFWEGTEAMLDDKDRLGYADFTLSGEDFPVEARFGHLRVDHERAMLLYNSLIDLTDKAAREVDPPIGFPITKSYPARQIVLFLMSEKSEAGNDVMAAFPGLTLEEKVQLLQRVMGGLSMSCKFSKVAILFRSTLWLIGCVLHAEFQATDQGLRTSSCESFHLFEAAGIRDDKQWQEYAHSIVPLYLPTVSIPAAALSGHQLIGRQVSTQTSIGGASSTSFDDRYLEY